MQISPLTRKSLQNQAFSANKILYPGSCGCKHFLWFLYYYRNPENLLSVINLEIKPLRISTAL